MQWIKRFYERDTDGLFKKGKVTVIYGARRVGKTELVKRLISSRNERVFWGTGEDLDLASVLQSRKTETYRLFFEPYDIVFIDEAQYIDEVGICLKMLVDMFPETSFIVTGSSSFNISQSTAEPLTGRSIVKTLYPISLTELKLEKSDFDIYRNFEEYLLYGMYPEIFSMASIKDKTEYLINLRNSYLFKDIFALEQVKNSSKLLDIVRLLALQVGSEISLNEIATRVGLSKNTVERYIDILEKAFIIKKIGSFSRNLRSELSKSMKYYFWDTGVRNAVINNFNCFEMRDDVGGLWENFVVMELVKKHEYEKKYSQFYFWRTYDQKELDLIIEGGGMLTGFEIKWWDRKTKVPELWQQTYHAKSEIITKENFLNFLR
jgi:predicted AAA+ superfamily ATPase